MKYMNRLLALAIIMLASCTAENLPEPEAGNGRYVSEKICNTSDNAVKGKIIAKFSEEAVPYVEAAVARGVATKSGSGAAAQSGIEALDEILEEIDAISVKRVFPVSERFEENTRKAGLHRWYSFTFSEEQDLDEAAEMLASVAEISTIQFNSTFSPSFSQKAIPLPAGAAPAVTRSIVRADFNDPELLWQWHYINNGDLAVSQTARPGADINVAEAWKLTAGDSRIIVAVVDEGVKYTHPDLAANMWTNPEPSEEYDRQDIHGWNFVDDGPITWDKEGKDQYGQETSDSGHGTHVAGTVAAVNNNALGVAGVAGGTGNGDGVRIMSCQIFSKGLGTNDEAICNAIKYAADHGAAIIQCSYGNNDTAVTSERDYRKKSPLEREALDYFMSPASSPEGGNTSDVFADGGGIAIYAAGNDGLSHSNFPGGYNDCISVTAVGPDGLPAYYTCYGPGCNIAAPGGEATGHSGGERAGILSTLVSEISGSDYGYMQGTSMACPHVSGVAALGLSYALKKDRKFTREEFTSMLLTSVNDIESRLEGTKKTGQTIYLEDYQGKMGSGLIDAYQLLMQIEGTPCLRVPVDELQMIPLTQYFGGSAENLTYRSLEISDEDMEKLGMPAKPEMSDGKLMIRCNKPGVAHITISAIAGGKRPGTDTVMGGIEVTKEFAIIARGTAGMDDGWL